MSIKILHFEYSPSMCIDLNVHNTENQKRLGGGDINYSSLDRKKVGVREWLVRVHYADADYDAIFSRGWTVQVEFVGEDKNACQDRHLMASKARVGDEHG